MREDQFQIGGRARVDRSCCFRIMVILLSSASLFLSRTFLSFSLVELVPFDYLLNGIYCQFSGIYYLKTLQD